MLKELQNKKKLAVLNLLDFFRSFNYVIRSSQNMRLDEIDTSLVKIIDDYSKVSRTTYYEVLIECVEYEYLKRISIKPKTRGRPIRVFRLETPIENWNLQKIYNKKVAKK